MAGDPAASATKKDLRASLPPELMAARQNQQVVLGELMQARVLRAAMSERQLNEVLVDFWFNHFNVDARKGRCALLTPSTSATPFVRTCSAGSGTCSARRRRARRCCSTWTTG